ncbi:hypothetical protein [Rhizobium leguminosarum]|nr:hypothetical protein [Rhizobium leguminosarum]
MNALNAQGNMAGRPGSDGHAAARRQVFCQRGMIGFAALFRTLSSS